MAVKNHRRLLTCLALIALLVVAVAAMRATVVQAQTDSTAADDDDDHHHHHEHDDGHHHHHEGAPAVEHVEAAAELPVESHANPEHQEHHQQGEQQHEEEFTAEEVPVDVEVHKEMQEQGMPTEVAEEVVTGEAANAQRAEPVTTEEQQHDHGHDHDGHGNHNHHHHEPERHIEATPELEVATEPIAEPETVHELEPPPPQERPVAEPEPVPVAEPPVSEPEPVRQQQPQEVVEQHQHQHQQQKQKHIDAPELTEGGSTIRWRAKVMPEGCVKAVEMYLHHINEGRAPVATAVRDARAVLNEARVHRPDQVAKAEAALAKAQTKLSAFDTDTIRTYGGDLPKTCIEEVRAIFDARPPVQSESNFIQTYAYFWSLIVGHAQVFGLLFQGEYAYRKTGYEPMVAHFNKFADTYYKKAKDLFNEAHPKPGLLDKITGKQKEVPTKDFILKTAQGMAYGCVPLAVATAGGIIVICFLPVVIAAMVVPDILYALYTKLFFFYYTYAMIVPDDVIVAAKATFEQVKSGQLAVVADKGIEAMLELAGEPDGFYNGILLAATAWTLMLAIFIVLLAYFMCMCGPRRSKKGASKETAAPAPATAAKKRN